MNFNPCNGHLHIICNNYYMLFTQNPFCAISVSRFAITDNGCICTTTPNLLYAPVCTRV